jgi:hypothetical protein
VIGGLLLGFGWSNPQLFVAAAAPAAICVVAVALLPLAAKSLGDDGR